MELPILTQGAALILGVVILLFGREAYWLLLGALGFGVGLLLAQRIFPESTEATWLLASLVLGLIGALLAITIQHGVAFVAGFILGGWLAVLIATRLSATIESQLLFQAIVFVVAGFAVGFLANSIFDWGLMVMSALAGAALIVEAIFRVVERLPDAPALPPIAELIGIVILAFVGVTFQYRRWEQQR